MRVPIAIQNLWVGAKAWRLAGLIVAAALQALIAVWFSGSIGVPGRDIRDVIFPFAPLSFALVMAFCSRPLLCSTLELRHPRRTYRRLIFLACVASAQMFSASIGIAVSVSPWLLVRNFLMFAGLILVVGEKNQATSLLILVVYCSAAWIIGAGGQVSPPQSWALPMHSPSSLWALGIAVLLAALGTIRFLSGKDAWSKSRG